MPPSHKVGFCLEKKNIHQRNKNRQKKSLVNFSIPNIQKESENFFYLKLRKVEKKKEPDFT